MMESYEFDDAMKMCRRGSALGMSPIDYDEDRLARDVAIEIKHDGIRAICGAMGITTLKGVNFDAASHILPELRHMEARMPGDWVIDGEYLSNDGFEGAQRDFQRGEGNGILMIFDAVPLRVWQGYAISQPWLHRRMALEQAFNAAGAMQHVGLSKYVTCSVDTAPVSLPASIDDAAGAAWDSGLEGVVVKSLYGPYIRGRSHHWMRVKRTATVELLVDSIFVQDGALVSVKCDYKGRTVSISSGFSDAQRMEFGRNGLPGDVIEVTHRGETAAGSLRHASFNRIRLDKSA